MWKERVSNNTIILDEETLRRRRPPSVSSNFREPIHCRPSPRVKSHGQCKFSCKFLWKRTKNITSTKTILFITLIIPMNRELPLIILLNFNQNEAISPCLPQIEFWSCHEFQLAIVQSLPPAMSNTVQLRLCQSPPISAQKLIENYSFKINSNPKSITT